jgi:hypothetical protein
MSKISLKKRFLVTLQVPVVLVLYLCEKVEMCLKYWLLTTGNPFLRPTTELAAKQTQNEQVITSAERDKTLATARKIIRRDNYRAFKAWLILHDDDFIDRARIALEAEIVGFAAFTRHWDRHLYAVLKPTRHENLRRIDFAFYAFTPPLRDAVVAAALADEQGNKRP